MAKGDKSAELTEITQAVSGGEQNKKVMGLVAEILAGHIVVC